MRVPHGSACGDKPESFSANAICDSDTKEWRESVELLIPEPDFATCEDLPPEGILYPVCDMATGEWLADGEVPLIDDYSAP